MNRHKIILNWHKQRMIFRLIALALVMIWAHGVAHAGALKIMASIPPLADVARQVGANMVEVHTLLKAGRGPHDYEPTPASAMKISQSDIALMAGMGLDNWLKNLVKSAGKPGAVLVDCSKAVGRDKIGANPHYWLDPDIMINVTRLVADTLADRMPGNMAQIRANSEAFIASVAQMDIAIKKKLRNAKAGFVVFHNAWSYFVRHYALNQVGAMELSPGHALSARRMARLADRIKETDARAVMVEPQFSPRLGQALARETGAQVVVVDPIGGVPGRNSYLALMKFNADRFSKTLEVE